MRTDLVFDCSGKSEKRMDILRWGVFWALDFVGGDNPSTRFGN
jgi:hypothetical protein